MFSVCCRNGVVPAPSEINENSLFWYSETVSSSYLISLHWWWVRVTFETICKFFVPKWLSYRDIIQIIIREPHGVNYDWKLDITHKCINTSAEHLQKCICTLKKAKCIYIEVLWTQICLRVCTRVCIYSHTHAHTHCWLNRTATAINL